MFRKLRIVILLFILVSVGLAEWRVTKRLASWDNTLQIALYPINADQRPQTQAYIASLQPSDFDEIVTYLEQEGRNYGLQTLMPVRVNLGGEVRRMPPERPKSANPLEALLWSLSLRYWAWQNANDVGIRPDLRIFLLFYDADQRQVLPESTGLSKGRIGLAHLFAHRNMHGSNLVVTTHELLHTLGATDKYDLGSLQPIFPAGFADPAQNPVYPQAIAEIMGGRIPLSPSRAEIPRALSMTMIGPATAREIGWSGR